jgi:hypothetical protein
MIFLDYYSMIVNNSLVSDYYITLVFTFIYFPIATIPVTSRSYNIPIKTGMVRWEFQDPKMEDHEIH